MYLVVFFRPVLRSLSINYWDSSTLISGLKLHGAFVVSQIVKKKGLGPKLRRTLDPSPVTESVSLDVLFGRSRPDFSSLTQGITNYSSLLRDNTSRGTRILGVRCSSGLHRLTHCRCHRRVPERFEVCVFLLLRREPSLLDTRVLLPHLGWRKKRKEKRRRRNGADIHVSVLYTSFRPIYFGSKDRPRVFPFQIPSSFVTLWNLSLLVVFQ